MKHFTTKKQKLGEFGENIAVKHLISLNFTILERNYTRKMGEIDLIALKDNVIHFLEIKTIITKNIPHYRTYNNPFENLNRLKLLRMKRTILLYLAEHNVSRDTSWVIDGVGVIVSRDTPNAVPKIFIQIMWNIV